MTTLALIAGQPREVRDRDPGPAEDRGAGGRGALRDGPEGLLGHAPQAQPGRLRAGERASPGCVRANALAALENVALWHERDISHSSVERVIMPDSFLALDHMLHRFTRIVRGMTVNEERMRRNLDLGQGLVFSGQLLLELTARGMRREDAYRVVQGHAMEAWKTRGRLPRARARRSRDPQGADARRRSTRCSASSGTSTTSTRSSRGSSARPRPAAAETAGAGQTR